MEIPDLLRCYCWSDAGCYNYYCCVDWGLLYLGFCLRGWRGWNLEAGVTVGTGASFLVASNFPSNSVGSSIFSEGRSSIGMKSSVSLSKSNSGRITSFSFGVLVAETF